MTIEEKKEKNRIYMQNKRALEKSKKEDLHFVNDLSTRAHTSKLTNSLSILNSKKLIIKFLRIK